MDARKSAKGMHVASAHSPRRWARSEMIAIILDREMALKCAAPNLPKSCRNGVVRRRARVVRLYSGRRRNEIPTIRTLVEREMFDLRPRRVQESTELHTEQVFDPYVRKRLFPSFYSLKASSDVCPFPLDVQ